MKGAKPTPPGVVVHRIAQPGEDDFSTPANGAPSAVDAPPVNAPKPPPGSAPSGLDVMSGRVRPSNSWDAVLGSLPPQRIL